MPLTSSAINLCNAVIHMADHLGVTYDISGQSNEAGIDLTNDVGDYKVFGTAGRGRLICGKDGSVSLSIYYTRGGNEAMDLLKRWYWLYREQLRYFAFYAPNESISSDKYYGYFALESFNIPFSAEEAAPALVEMNLLPNFGIEWAVQGT